MVEGGLEKTNIFLQKGGTVAEWSMALLEKEKKIKLKRFQVCPPAWAIFLFFKKYQKLRTSGIN